MEDQQQEQPPIEAQYTSPPPINQPPDLMKEPSYPSPRHHTTSDKEIEEEDNDLEFECPDSPTRKPMQIVKHH